MSRQTVHARFRASDGADQRAQALADRIDFLLVDLERADLRVHRLDQEGAALFEAHGLLFGLFMQFGSGLQPFGHFG